MSGIDDLHQLIQQMKPRIMEHDLVFCSVKYSDLPEVHIDPLLLFREDEGVTLVMSKNTADKLGLDYTAQWARILLTVHSDLEAVGFLAKITEALANDGISCNVVSAFYHDHLFVPTNSAKDALNALEKLIQLYQCT